MINGYEVPNWLQAEARSEVAIDAIQNSKEFLQFVYQNYTSDMNPTTHGHRVSL